MFRDKPASSNGSDWCAKLTLVLLCSVVIIVTSPQFYIQSLQDINSQFITNLSQPNSTLAITYPLPSFNYGFIYQGIWQKSDSKAPISPFLSQVSGILRLHINQRIEGFPYKKTSAQHIQVQFLRKQYVDQGSLCFDIYLEKYNFGSDRQSDKKVTFFLYNSTNGHEINFRDKSAFSINNKGTLYFTTFNLTAQVLSNDQLTLSIIFGNEDHQFFLTLASLQDKVVAYHILGIFFIIISISNAIYGMGFVRKVERSNHNLLEFEYSSLTVALASMWDSALSFLCFILTTNNYTAQYSLILFIAPGCYYLMSSLLFAFLSIHGKVQLTMTKHVSPMASIKNTFKILFMFSCFFFLNLVVVWYLLTLTGLNWLFFICCSLIILPQIYKNAKNNIKPQLLSKYHCCLFSRFFLIVYLRCYPGNIFMLEPDYLLGFLCLALVGGQFGLLFIQNRYGPKSVIPSCLRVARQDKLLNDIELESAQPSQSLRQ